MRSKSQNSIIVAGTTLILLIGGLLLYNYLSKDHWSWNISYEPDDKNPYGGALFHELLEKSNPDQYVFTVDSLSTQMPVDPTGDVDNYLFLGNRPYIDSADAEVIIDFIEKGNNAFFFCDNFSNRVTDSLLMLVSNIAYTSEATPEISDEILDEAEYTTAEIADDSINAEEKENYHVDTVVYFNQETQLQETLFVDTSSVTEEELSEEEYTDETVYVEEEYEPVNEWYQTDFTGDLYDSIITLEIKNHTLPKPAELSKKYEFKNYVSDWAVIMDLQTIHGDSMEVIGTFNDSLPNFVRFPIGQGYLYLHSTPIAFTNLPLSNDSIMPYAQEISRSFGKGKIYWDEENRNWDSNAFKKDGSNYDDESSEGPLEFILSEPSLRTAWYFILLAIVLYIFFGAKRKQRIIPVIETMENTSIEYAEVISQLFMRQKDHKSLVKLKTDLFRVELRERHGLRLPSSKEDEDEEWFKKVSQKTGARIDLIKRIYERIHYFENAVDVNTEQMLIFHNYLEEFNATAR